MTKKEIVNVSTSAAEICEREFVPAMFTQWSPQLARLEATLAIKETSDGSLSMDLWGKVSYSPPI